MLACSLLRDVRRKMYRGGRGKRIASHQGHTGPGTNCWAQKRMRPQCGKNVTEQLQAGRSLHVQIHVRAYSLLQGARRKPLVTRRTRTPNTSADPANHTPRPRGVFFFLSDGAPSRALQRYQSPGLDESEHPGFQQGTAARIPLKLVGHSKLQDTTTRYLQRDVSPHRTNRWGPGPHS